MRLRNGDDGTAKLALATSRDWDAPEKDGKQAGSKGRICLFIDHVTVLQETSKATSSVHADLSLPFALLGSERSNQLFPKEEQNEKLRPLTRRALDGVVNP